MKIVPLNDPSRALRLSSKCLINAVTLTLESGYWLNGPYSERFCHNFSRYIGVSHCIGVSNGSDALEIALRALLTTGRATGDELITVPNAGGYSTIASLQVGLTPVYADIEYESQLISISSILNCLTDRTAVVVVTHLYGGSVNVPLLRHSLDDAGYKHVPILEDCAQAHGARVGQSYVGSLGDIATFSFYPTKNYGACGDAGAIVTDDEELFNKAKMLSQYGWSQKYIIEVPLGRNSRLDEIQALYLDNILGQLDEKNSRRRHILSQYLDSLPVGVTLAKSPIDTVAHLAILLVDQRDLLRTHLSDHLIASDIHYPTLDVDQPGWIDLPKRVDPNGISVARASVRKLLTLPCFPEMTDSEVERVCSALCSFQTTDL